MSDKAIIITVGKIEDGQPVGWELDCKNEVPAFALNTNPDGTATALVGGYSIEELKQISDEYWA